MMRRSVFACFAAGLLASLAFAAPSQAGTIVTTNLSFPVISPEPTSVVIDYAGAGTISDPVLLSSVPVGSTVSISAPDQVTVTFTGAITTGEAVAFTFASTTPFGNGTPPDITISSATAQPGGQTPPTILASVSFSASAIPEPTSIALLGIGMTGFLAFRRLFKRTSVA